MNTRLRIKKNCLTCEGLIIIVETQLNIYAEKGPKACIKYPYSAPELKHVKII